MKRSMFCAVLLPWLALSWTPTSNGVELLLWERLPLTIPLQVGLERVVFVERNVRVGVPASLTGKLRVQSAGGAVYLRAQAPIDPVRLQLQDSESGELILLDIFTVEAGSGKPALEPIRIVEREKISQTQPLLNEGNATRPTPIPVVLTRYAAQSLYAPLRTVEALPGIRRVNIKNDIPLQSLLPSLPVNVKALAGWRLDDYWITAIRLSNTSEHWLEVDPRTLQGNFISATFQHDSLGPKGLSSDTSVVYLVTRGHGLMEALSPAISSFDAATNLSQKPEIARDEK